MYFLLFLTLCNTNIVFKLKNIIKCDYEYSCRVASLFHAIISFFGSILFLYNFIDLNKFNQIAIYNSIYILTDLYLYYSNKISNKDIVEMTIHHLFFLMASYYSSLNPIFYCYGIMSEGSTIFLNLRWFSIKENNQYKIKIYTNLFAIFFFVFRIINITNLTYNLYHSDIYYLTTICIPFLILNYIWFYNLSIKIINNYKLK